MQKVRDCNGSVAMCAESRDMTGTRKTLVPSGQDGSWSAEYLRVVSYRTQ